MMMPTFIKQHLSNIWSSIHEKVKHHWGWVQKCVVYKKSVYNMGNSFFVFYIPQYEINC